MPKVTEQHIEARRHQVLRAAAACFARNGFHQTSMQDICQEAQLSCGGVYLYFSSKEEIIRGMGEESLARIEKMMALVEAQGSTTQMLDALADVAFGRLARPDMVEHCKLDIELWGEALRNPQLMEIQRRIIDALRTKFSAIVREGQRRGEITRSVDADAVARLMISMFEGLVLQKTADWSVDIPKYVKALKRMMAGLFVQSRRRKGGNGHVRVRP